MKLPAQDPRRKESLSKASFPSLQKDVLRVMGVDPGSQNTGYGIIEIQNHGKQLRLTAQSLGVLASRAENFHGRLLEIGQDFGTLLDRYQPDLLVIEKIFLAKNVDSAFKLGHARGILMFQALQRRLSLYEIATRVVKKVVAGSGAADKLQVQRSLQFLLKIPPSTFDSLPLDASDALALAYAFADSYQKERLMK